MDCGHETSKGKILLTDVIEPLEFLENIISKVQSAIEWISHPQKVRTEEKQKHTFHKEVKKN